MKTPTKKELKIILRAVQSAKRRMHQAVQNDGGGKGMNQKLPAIIGIAGFVIFWGAEGDAYCNTGSYIIERAVIGAIMVIGGWAWAKLRERRSTDENHARNAQSKRRLRSWIS